MDLFDYQMSPEKRYNTKKFLKGLIEEWGRLLIAHGSTGVAQYGFAREQKMKLENVRNLITDLELRMKEIKKEKNKDIEKLQERVEQLKEARKVNYTRNYHEVVRSSSSDPASS